ncbi:hypothetical protein [Komagataeibacter sp. SM21]|uniref:hypothetical protein n=1 Tax=Komagataeibacter sp. SM21 TaxID=3242899 RepID=UPI0035280820
MSKPAKPVTAPSRRKASAEAGSSVAAEPPATTAVRRRKGGAAAAAKAAGTKSVSRTSRAKADAGIADAPPVETGGGRLTGPKADMMEKEVTSPARNKRAAPKSGAVAGKKRKSPAVASKTARADTPARRPRKAAGAKGSAGSARPRRSAVDAWRETRAARKQARLERLAAQKAASS